MTEQQQVVFDQQGQLDKIVAGLMQGEQVIAVYDAIGAGTGFIGLTNKRVVIQDNSYVGKKIALTSVPYSRIVSVSFVSNKSFAGRFFSSSTISIVTSSGAHEVEFRGDDKAKHVHDLVLWKILL
jgi:hypothetical protein